jgi:hypothetical protein
MTPTCDMLRLSLSLSLARARAHAHVDIPARHPVPTRPKPNLWDDLGRPGTGLQHYMSTRARGLFNYDPRKPTKPANMPSPRHLKYEYS